MKKHFDILENRDTFLVVNKSTPLYAGEAGRYNYPILEKELYKDYKHYYYVVYPMEYWCSGILFVSKDMQDTSLTQTIIHSSSIFTYELIVRNPVFFTQQTVTQKIALRGKKFEINLEGDEITAEFKLIHKYKDFSYVEVKTNTPFHQGILLLSSFLGSPVLGDGIYGLRQPLLLSALKKRKYKPKSDEEELPLMQRPAIHLKSVKSSLGDWTTDLPKDFRLVLMNLKKHNTLVEETFLEGWLKDLKSEG